MSRVAWLIIWTINLQFLFISFKNLIPHGKVLIKNATPSIQVSDVEVFVQGLEKSHYTDAMHK